MTFDFHSGFTHVDTSRIQYLAIAGSIVLLAFIFMLARTGRIRVQYCILWFALGLAFLFVSVWRHGLEQFAQLVGIAYAPAAIFLVLIVGILAILIHFSVVISHLAEQNRILAQEMALAKSELAALKDSVEKDRRA